MIKLSEKIVDSTEKIKTKREKDKEDTGGLSAGSSGASGGNYKVDFKSKLNSGRDKIDASCDNKESKEDSRFANRKLNNQLLSEHQLLREMINSSHGKSTEELSQRGEFERRRRSLPSNNPQEQQLETTGLPRQRSEPLLRRELNLNDPLTTSVLNNLELLEGLAKILDKEYKCGEVKCWKHLSEHFGVEAKTYEDFTRSQERSPTEDLFEFLRTREPKEFTVGKLKDKLSSINRPDVHLVLPKAEFDDKTQVDSLFESHPQVIAKIALLLDKETPGKRNWKYLADMFGVPRSESQNFGESIHENPTKQLFEHLCVKKPQLTTAKLKEHLRILKMQDVLEVLAESKKVKDNSPLKDLWEDLEILARVWNLLNKKHTIRIRWWRLLGNQLGVKKDTLDMFSNEREMISPTEVLINHLAATRPSLTLGDLVLALERIERPDALSVVEAFFPDGHISSFLVSKRAQSGHPQ